MFYMQLVVASTWFLAEKRRLHATRKSVMINKRLNKKRRNVSDPSDIISLDGSTTPHDWWFEVFKDIVF